jgi:hypothetical protein
MIFNKKLISEARRLGHFVPARERARESFRLENGESKQVRKIDPLRVISNPPLHKLNAAGNHRRRSGNPPAFKKM